MKALYFGCGHAAVGLGSALASAMLKVVDALPASYRDTAADADQRGSPRPQWLRTSLRDRATAIAVRYEDPC